MLALRLIALALTCILAPVIAVTIGTIAFVGDLGAAGEYSLGLIGTAMVGIWLGVVVGVPTMLLVGLPLHAHFQRRSMTGLTPYALGGALAGVLASLAFMLAPPPSGWLSWSHMVSGWWRLVESWEISAKVLIFGALTGVLAASMFWLLWLLRRPVAIPTTPTP